MESSGSARVLLIEDNRADALLFTAIADELEEPRVVVEAADTLEYGLERLRMSQFELIVLDIGLPDANGLEALELLLAEQATLPVVVLTGRNDDRLGRLAIQRGAQEFIRKRDLSASTLQRTISQAFERIRQRDMERHLAQAAGWAALGQLSAGVAHEINNPISTVLLNLEDLRDGLLAQLGRGRAEEEPLDHEELLKLAENSLDATRRIGSLVASLSSFSAIAHRDVTVVDLTEALRTAVAAVETEIRTRAELSLELEQVPTLIGDRARIIQVFVNLLINACHALDRVARPQHRISVSLRRVGEEVLISVSDTGSGIPVVLVQKIFDPFFTTKGRSGGSGLGLSVSRTTIEQHQGRIRVFSDPNGTRFEVTIPFDTGLELKDEGEAVVAPPTKKPHRILLVEDEEALRRALMRRMSKAYEVIAAATVDEGLKWVETSDAPFDLILCDLMMPVKDGKDFYDAMHRTYPHSLDALVFMTGGAFTERISEFISDSPRPILFKPFQLSDVQALLAQIEGG